MINKFKRKTTEQFIKEAMILCKNKNLDYSKVEYKNTLTKVTIICHKKGTNNIEHGEFKIRPNDFLLGHYYQKCGREEQIKKRRSNKDEFIKKCKIVHKENIDYSKIEYVNSRTKVCFICPEHGEFWQNPANYLQGSGCPKCGRLLAQKSIMKMQKLHLLRKQR